MSCFKLILDPFRSTHLHTLEKLFCIYTTINIDIGITGFSFLYGLGKISYQEVIAHIENKLLPQLKALNHISEASWHRIWKANKNAEPLSELYALAAMDIAMWDIFTKLNKLSLHERLGGLQQSVPLYGTTGWLSLTEDELVDECQYYATLGIKAFKVRLGHPDDQKRIALLRKVMGDDFILMVDANQRYNLEQAIKISERLIDFNITWFEEPINNSLNVLKEFKKNSPLLIALGENLTQLDEFREACEANVATFIQPDVMRCGGITGFKEVMQLVSNTNLQLCSHLKPELSVSLINTCKNSYMLEYDNLLPPEIFTHDFSVSKGLMKIPKIIGTGVELTKEALNQFSI